jgi:hypothetical protein
VAEPSGRSRAVRHAAESRAWGGPLPPVARARFRSRDRTCSGPGFLCRSGYR